MAEKKTVTLPEAVAAKYKYVGNGHTKFILPKFGGVTVNLETITPKVAEQIVDHVHFLARKPKPKAPKKD